MFLFSLFVFFLCATGSEVTVLNKSNFDKFIFSNEFVLVEFYAPWCGHCKKLEPEYEEAAVDLKMTGSPVRLAKVDATEEQELAERFGIQGFPTLKFFRSGDSIEYDGGRKAREIVSWVSKKSGPPSKLLTSQEEIDKFISLPGSKALGFLSVEESEDWLKNAADAQLKFFDFAHLTDTSLFGNRAVGTIELHKEGETPITYSEEEGSVSEWLLAEGFPLVDELSQDSWSRILGSGKDLLAVFSHRQSESAFEAALAVAKPNKASFGTTYSPSIELAAQWGASGKVFPTAILVKHNSGDLSFVIWNEETETVFDATTLATFVESARAGTYSSFRKSEPIPESNDEPVTVVVGKSFDSIVRSDKDVLVKFYAPWCGHCKKLQPTFDELGKFFSNDDSVVIAKYDSTANAVPPDFKVSGYPTLVLVDGQNNIKYFEGERDFDSLLDFVLANRVTKTGKIEL